MNNLDAMAHRWWLSQRYGWLLSTLDDLPDPVVSLLLTLHNLPALPPTDEA